MRLPILIQALLILAVNSGCVSRTASRVASKTELPVEQFYVHTVSDRDETPRMIAAWYTGDPNNAPQIIAGNCLSLVSRMKIGQVIRIPMELTSQSHRMTPEFILQSRRLYPDLTKAQLSKTRKPSALPHPQAEPETDSAQDEAEIEAEADAEANEASDGLIENLLNSGAVAGSQVGLGN